MGQRPLKTRCSFGLFLVNLFILLLRSESTCVLPKLRAVSLLVRHGARSPTATYPNDPYRDYPWPGGFGALSPKGEEQMYEAGLILADRYLRMLFNGLYSDGSCTFDINKIYVQSSFVQRCIDSAEKFLKSFLHECFLLNHSSGDNFIKNLINVTPEPEDEILAIQGKPCPKHEGILFSPLDLRDPEIRKIFKYDSRRGEEIIAFIKNETGLSDFNTASFIRLDDALVIQKANGLELPAWTDSVFERYIRPITDVLYNKVSFSEYQSIRSGGLLKDMVDRLQGAIQGNSNETVLFYSAHDISVSGMLGKLEAANQTIFNPDYGGMFALELHDNSKLRDDVEVKIYYSVDHDDLHPLRIDIPQCESPCSFKEFIEIVRPKFTLDYEGACAADR